MKKTLLETNTSTRAEMNLLGKTVQGYDAAEGGVMQSRLRYTHAKVDKGRSAGQEIGGKELRPRTYRFSINSRAEGVSYLHYYLGRGISGKNRLYFPESLRTKAKEKSHVTPEDSLWERGKERC